MNHLSLLKLTLWVRISGVVNRLADLNQLSQFPNKVIYRVEDYERVPQLRLLRSRYICNRVAVDCMIKMTKINTLKISNLFINRSLLLKVVVLLSHETREVNSHQEVTQT